MNAIKILATIAGLVTPLMYFHGQVYYQAILKFWHLPEDLFPLSFELSLIHGFIAYYGMGAAKLTVLGIWVLAIWGLLFNLYEFSKEERFNQFLGKVLGFLGKAKDQRAGRAELAKVERLAFRLSAVGLSVIFVLGTISWATGESERLGEKAGERQLERFLASNPPLADITLEKDESLQGQIINCSEDYCGIFASGMVHIVPTARIKSINWPVQASEKPSE